MVLERWIVINWIQVFLGGMLGAFLRYTLTTFTTTSAMLWIANIVGSFLLGTLNGMFEKKKNQFQLFLTTGMLGSFTTFSAFSEAWFHRLQADLLTGLLYGVLMTLSCVLAASVGYFLNRGNKL